MNRLKILLILILTGTASVSQAWRDLETGTFMTRDPIGFEDGPNQYSYVHGNPITKFDPLGLKLVSSENVYQKCIEPMSPYVSFDPNSGQVSMKGFRVDGTDASYSSGDKNIPNGITGDINPVDGALMTVVNAENTYSLEAGNSFEYNAANKTGEVPAENKYAVWGSNDRHEEALSYSAGAGHEIGHMADQEKRPESYQKYLDAKENCGNPAGVKRAERLEDYPVKIEDAVRKQDGISPRSFYGNEPFMKQDRNDYKRTFGVEPETIVEKTPMVDPEGYDD